MLDPAGVFVVPANCSANILVKFITDHMDEAAVKMEENTTAKEEEEEVRNDKLLIKLLKDCR